MLKSAMGNAIVKRMIEVVDHQAIVIPAQVRMLDGPALHVAAQAFQYPALIGFARERRVEGEADTDDDKVSTS